MDGVPPAAVCRMTCPVCQFANPEGAVFCNSCGAPLRVAAAKAPDPNLTLDAPGGAQDPAAALDAPIPPAADPSTTMDVPAARAIDPNATLDTLPQPHPKRKVLNTDAMATVDRAVFAPAQAQPAAADAETVKVAALTPRPASPSFSMSASGVMIPDFGARYEVEKVLGQGGMGAVYKARDKELDRTVALKLLRPDIIPDQNAIARFKQELLLASKVSHKNILRIHDLGDANGLKFISMAYIEGEDLHQLLEREGALPIERAVNLARQIVAALEAAHAEGVVHRDLKPQNVLLAAGDAVFLSDFGLAKSTGTENVAQTMSGQFVGTPQYMSPEQVEGRPTDHRGDIYAFGLLLYEMLTGKVTFSGSSVFQIMYQRVQGRAPNPKVLRADIPDYLVRIIDRCLERDPELRYQSAQEILRDIDAQRPPEGSGTFERRAKRLLYSARHSRGTWAVAGTLALVLVLALAVPASRNLLLSGLRRALGTSEVKPSKYVAVLPFKVTGEQPELRYAADGIVEAITGRLFQVKSIHTETTSSLQKFNPDDPPEKLGKALGASVVISGTVQGQGDKLRIVAKLSEVKSGQVLWTQEFPGVQKDLLTLEDQIYAKLIAALQVKLTSGEMAASSLHPTENVEAYQAYLRGRNLMRGQLDVENVKQAIAVYEDALKRDPNFVLAYTGIADASMRMYKETKDSKWADRALSAGQQAATLNDSLPEVHVALGSIYSQTGKQTEAIAELQRATALAPNADEGYRRLGDAYLAAGKKAESLAAYHKAIELNPYYWFNYNVLGTASVKFGDYEAALAAFQKVTEIDPNNAAAQRNIGATYIRQGKYAEAVPVLQKALTLEKHRTGFLNLGTALFFLKRYPESVEQFQHAVEMGANYEPAVGSLADAYRWSGKPTEAAQTYDRAIELALQQLQTNPKDAQAMGRLATYYAKKGDKARAEQFIRQARTVNPGDNWLMYTEGEVKAILGDEPGAVSALQAAFANKYPRQEAQNDPELAKLQQRADYKQMMAK